ncbi:hypothetical protein DL93DRAFT_2082964 [Clavulina sp. PMI_390]|nr:hypothetical protein DL93DRAFT_2082964 [Clavulina sp. PMI_390]
MSFHDDKTAIFWDLDGEAIPPIGMGISEACEALRLYGHDYGRVCEFRAYISPASDTELSQSTRLASDLRQNGVSLSLHHPSNNSPGSSAGAKELVMISDILVFVLDYGTIGGTPTIILVTNDHSTLAYPLSLLRNRNCQVVVLSTRDMSGQPRYVRRLDAVWSMRGEILPPPPQIGRISSPRLPHLSRAITNPQQQSRARSHSRSQANYAAVTNMNASSAPALLRGPPQFMPAAGNAASMSVETLESTRHYPLAHRQSNSLTFNGEDNIPSFSLVPTNHNHQHQHQSTSPQLRSFGLTSPKISPPRIDTNVANHIAGMNGHTAGAAAGIGGREGPPQVHMHQQQMSNPASNNAVTSTSNSTPNPMSVRRQTSSQPIQPALHNRSSSTHLSQRSMTPQLSRAASSQNQSQNRSRAGSIAPPQPQLPPQLARITIPSHVPSLPPAQPVTQNTTAQQSQNQNQSVPQPTTNHPLASVAAVPAAAARDREASQERERPTDRSNSVSNSAPRSPPVQASEPPSSPWSFNSVASAHLDLPPHTAAPSISDDDASQATIRSVIRQGATGGGDNADRRDTLQDVSELVSNIDLVRESMSVSGSISTGASDGPRPNDPPSPSISTQSTNLWLHGTHGGVGSSIGIGGGYFDGMIPRADSPIGMAFESALAEKRERPDPHAFAFKAPSGPNPPANAYKSAGPQVMSAGSAALEQLNEHKPFGTFGLSGNAPAFAPSVQSAQSQSSRFDNNIGTEGPTSAYSRAPSTAQSYAPSSVDRGIPYPTTSAGSTVTIQPPRPPIGQGHHRGSISLGGPGLGLGGPFSGGVSAFGGASSYPPIPNVLAQPRSPRTHSRMSSYSSTHSFPTASSPSPPTPPFGLGPIGSGPVTHGLGLSAMPGGAGIPLGNGIGNGNVAPGPGPGPGISTLSGPPPSALHQHNLSQSSTSSQPPAPSTPISFHPLIRVLEKFRAQGLFAPLRSAVGSELRQGDPHVYDKLGGGIRTFKEYAGAAERSGLVVLIGGSPGKEKISLVK